MNIKSLTWTVVAVVIALAVYDLVVRERVVAR